MNFKKLQAMQAKLDETILSDKLPMTAEERFNKTLVALSVEIAEVANCAEHFKFWKDGKGKVDSDRFYRISQTVREGEAVVLKYVDLESNHPGALSFAESHKLTLVEEASDCLHFILSLANQAGVKIVNFNQEEDTTKEDAFIKLLQGIAKISASTTNTVLTIDIRLIFNALLTYFCLLGIEPQELEQAYYDKNKINYERLENGY